ncbi:MAG: Wzz/FepE/Etk N-terminal domain-containing protein [Bacteroidetes bacterium]|nr:Wzz/FepE/Etk N-terminal domain-containing protein [Bacteroidota bacterium]MCL5027333.1 Wzz/FepE/Etk N-terminal domain-containing protein [Chloroflexota bacterium]
MELRQYWGVVQRRLWVVIALTLIALIASVAMRPERDPTYKVTIKLAVKPTAEARSQNYYGYDGYYAYVVSEYLNDDIAEVVKSNDFMTELRNRLKDRPGGPPGGYIEARKAHRVLTLTVTAPSERDGKDIAATAAKMLQEDQQKYLGGISDQNPSITIVDEPVVAVGPAPARDAVDIALRTALGLIAGLMLAFLLEYLDTSLRTPGEVSELLKLPVLGELPKEKGRRRAGSAA